MMNNKLMDQHFESLVIIPARGGSKGIKYKNLCQISGIPLIAHSINATRGLENALIVVSTDDKKIAETAQNFGASVPFLRPKALADDYCSPTQAVYFTLKKLINQKISFDFVMQVQPTYFYRTPDLIKSCLNHLKENENAECLVTVRKIEDTSHPQFIGKIDSDGYLKCRSGDLFRRQNLKPAYAFFGSVMIARSDYFLLNKTFYGNKLLPFVVENHLEHLDINIPSDLVIAEAVMNGKLAE